jgi:hypothetical protein
MVIIRLYSEVLLVLMYRLSAGFETDLAHCAFLAPSEITKDTSTETARLAIHTPPSPILESYTVEVLSTGHPELGS